MNKTRIVGKELLKHGRYFFSMEQIIKATGFSRNNVRDILLIFWRENYLVRIQKHADHSRRKGPPLMSVRYRVISPAKLAERIVPKYRGENNSSDRIWFVIRKKRTFTRRDLCVLAGASKEHVRWYTKMLARAGYIRTSERSGEWVLIKNPGPRRPYVGDQKKHKAQS
jgi:hypothetical protein